MTILLVKRTIIKALLTLCIAFAFTTASAQSRDWGIGVKLGTPTAISIKHYTGKTAWEGNIGANIRNRFAFQLHYLIHNDISASPNWKWYYGIGPQIQIGHYHRSWERRNYHHHRSNFDLGVDGVIGTEYRFANAPFSIFMDVNVFVEIIDNPLDLDLQGGIGIRYDF